MYVLDDCDGDSETSSSFRCTFDRIYFVGDSERFEILICVGCLSTSQRTVKDKKAGEHIVHRNRIVDFPHGKIIGARHPRVSCLHAAEHVVALVFSDIAKLWQVNVLVGIYRKAFAVFGSGSMHVPYAIFQTHAKQHNDGRVSRALCCVLVSVF